MPFSLLQAKENGEVTESAAASMSEEAYNLLCKHAVTAGSAFRWAWLTLQWNLGCRSVNVAKVLLNHMGVEGDAVTISFARTKSDLAGDVRQARTFRRSPRAEAFGAVLFKQIRGTTWIPVVRDPITRGPRVLIQTEPVVPDGDLPSAPADRTAIRRAATAA